MSTGRLLTEDLTLPDGTRMPARKVDAHIYTLANPAYFKIDDTVDHEGEPYVVAAVCRSWDRVTILTVYRKDQP